MAITKVTRSVIDDSVFQTTLSSNGSKVLTINDIDLAGGLSFNNNQQLRISPAAVAATILVVRPSDVNSTDSKTATRTIQNDPSNSLMPYFKTLKGAIRWASANLITTVQIFLDEDTNETEFDITGTFSSQLTGAYYANPPLDLPAGFYVWHNNNGNWATLGGNAVCHLGGRQSPDDMYFNGDLNVLGRYWTGGSPGSGTAYATKVYNEPIRKVNIRAFVCTNPALTFGNFGSSRSVWTTQTGFGVNNQRYIYFAASPNNLAYSPHNVYVNSVHFVIHHNISGTYPVDWFSTGQCTLVNTTYTLSGDNYNATLIRVWNSGVLSIGPGVQRNPSSPLTRFDMPGWGLAIVGNQLANERTNCGSIIVAGDAETPGVVRSVDYGILSRLRGYDSSLTDSIILDGRFGVINNLFYMSRKSTISLNGPLLRTTATNFQSINWTDTNYLTFSNTNNLHAVEMTKLNTFKMGGSVGTNINVFRAWGENGVPSTTFGQIAIPYIGTPTNGASAAYGAGTFTIAGSDITYTINNASVGEVQLYTSNAAFGNQTNGNSTTGNAQPVNSLPLVTTFYNNMFDPGNSATYNLVYK